MKPNSHFKFRKLNNELLVSNEVGDFNFFRKDVVGRFYDANLDDNELKDFKDLSILIDDDEKWKYYSLARRVEQKYAPTKRKISYLILIPTLRCNLSCSYCQVSRAPEKAKGFDWTPETLKKFDHFLSESDIEHLKVEFQGGEPTLRLDLIEDIIAITKKHSSSCEFVICSNMVELDPKLIELVETENFSISTSIDGSLDTMTENRTFEDDTSQKVFDNFQYILNRFGPEKIAALPTITETQINNPEELINTYTSLGFQSIFLRPVNYMGFARKQHKDASHAIREWNEFYLSALNLIKERNKLHYFEEFYLAMLVREIFSRSSRGFVDYRSPSRFLNNYLVIDFDEQIYPSDEARMLSRTRHVDLAMGSLQEGIDEQKAQNMNLWAENQTHPDCMHCVYQPYCGIDIVDDMSRYDRFDMAKNKTWFCNRQMFLFDFIFDKVQRQDKEWLDIFLRWISRSTTPIHSYEIFS
ncbi:His-Xaa-Ser system radical SAM maturase HxsB [Gammaproteobacteria bacterium]|jgi:His-Xaa-Ser system radical SAM maturase HxsB|nr:His-Xaa-Ser system radical SAM maturase HxsB [Gammaproteobacteria bacterium]